MSGTAGEPSERIVRHPNGHLMVERTPPWVPSQEATDAALASLAKAWPVLAQHAPHIDGEFDLALTDLRRMVDALRAAAAATRPGLLAAAALYCEHCAAGIPVSRLNTTVPNQQWTHWPEGKPAKWCRVQRIQDALAALAAEGERRDS